jgi:hypothetical protein
MGALVSQLDALLRRIDAFMNAGGAGPGFGQPWSNTVNLTGGLTATPPSTPGGPITLNGTGGAGGGNLFGTYAARPAASSVASGTVYFATDTGAISVSNGTTWAVLPSTVGATLGVPGTVTKPPTVAGGGWALVNTGTGSVTPTDAPYGIEFAVPSNAGAFSAGLGYVRTGSGSSTMSVEAGAVALNTGVTGSFAQQMFWGAMLYEQATGKFISAYAFQPMASAGETGPISILLEGSGGVSAQAQSNFYSYAQPYVRLRLDGSGHIICEFSVDKNRWTNIGSTYTVNVSTVFTTGPDHVGFALAQSEAAATTYVSAFDFVTT